MLTIVVSAIHLLLRALSLEISRMSTSALALSVGLMVTLGKLRTAFRRGGWDAVKSEGKQDTWKGAQITLLMWSILFLFFLGEAIFQDHTGLVAANRRLRNEVNQLTTRETSITEDGSIVAVGRLQMSRSPTHRRKFFINVYLHNRGKAAAKNEAAYSYRLSDRELTTQEETEDIKLTTFGASGKHFSEIQPKSDNTFFTVEVDDDAYKGVAHGAKYLYLYISLRFHDDSMPADAIGMTQFCTYFTKTFSISHHCLEPNRTFERLHVH